jgi:hypothetical protein
MIPFVEDRIRRIPRLYSELGLSVEEIHETIEDNKRLIALLKSEVKSPDPATPGWKDIECSYLSLSYPPSWKVRNDLMESGFLIALGQGENSPHGFVLGVERIPNMGAPPLMERFMQQVLGQEGMENIRSYNGTTSGGKQVTIYERKTSEQGAFLHVTYIPHDDSLFSFKLITRSSPAHDSFRETYKQVISSVRFK